MPRSAITSLPTVRGQRRIRFDMDDLVDKSLRSAFRFDFPAHPGHLAARIGRSAISYPYLSILDGANSAAPTGYTLPTVAQTVAFASNSIGTRSSNPRPRSAMISASDARLPDGQTVIEGDIFRTNLFNQFLQATYGNGTTGLLCPSTGGYTPNGAGTSCVGTGGATAPYISVPLYTTQYVNLGDARYDGAEIAIRSTRRWASASTQT